MFENAGEDLEGAFYRCPGETGCERFRNAAGRDHQEKSLACIGCGKCNGNGPPEPGDEGQVTGDETEAIDDLVNDIADIVAWEDAGFATDWSEYPFETKQLVRVWRAAEQEVREIRDRRMQVFIKGFFKE